jgi:integrase
MFVRDRKRQIIFRHYLGERAGLQDTLSLKKFRLGDREWSALTRHVEAILAAHRSDVPHMRHTIEWVDALPKHLGNYLRSKLLAYDPAFVQTKHDLDESIGLYEAYRSEQKTSLATDTAVMRDVERLRLRCPSDITRIEPGLLSDLLAELADEHSYAPNTLARIAKNWNAFFGWLTHIERAISINPCDELPKEIGTREKDTIRTEWIDAMVQACQTTEERYWLRLLQWTGCRLSEGLQLRIADFDFEKGRILIAETKNDRVRVNPLYPAIGQYLHPLFKGREPTELVLKRMTYNTCYKWLRSMQVKLGLPQWSPPYQSFRSTRANQLAADPNITPQQAGMLLGHSAVVARKNYLSVDDSLLEKLRVAA